jgi:two-component system sensor histidine kinase and response regulator WspE
MSYQPEDMSDFSMLDLFRVEAESQTAILTSGLLALERAPASAQKLEELMRAAHSLKGAARIVGLDAAVQVAHAMEDCFVAAQNGALPLRQEEIDVLLTGVDLLGQIAKDPGGELEVASATQALLGLLQTAPESGPISQTSSAEPEPGADPASSLPAQPPGGSKGVLRVTADNLNRLLGLAGESLVESRWPGPFAAKLLRLKRMQADLGRTLEALREALHLETLSEQAARRLSDAQQQVSDCRQFLAERLVDIEQFDRRSANLAHRLYREVLDCRMRPFGDGVQAFPRMVRDLARSLGKEARLEITGLETAVDRDMLERLEAPLIHLLRNAVDHGIETPRERRSRGKPAEGRVSLEARHASGMLLVIVSDDGRGIDLGAIRAEVVARGLTNPEIVGKLSESELLEFLFLPGFTMKPDVTEISGRGVGLDVVQAMLKQVRGTIRLVSSLGQGTQAQLQLPLTLSVLRTLLVEVAGESYAFPLAHICRTIKLPRGRIESLEGRQHFALDEQRVGLVTAHQILEVGEARTPEEVSVVVLGERGNLYGVVVDRFVGEQELVVQALEPRLGKIKDISAAAVMADGSPTLIVDVEDMVHSIEKLVAGGRLAGMKRSEGEAAVRKHKRVLVVDDSLTVRELERKLLEKHGYEVEIAVDGMDAWNAARSGEFDLILTDVDMPRMDGIELVTLVKRDPRLQSTPTLIVSYKDRPEDRRRGLEAGADYYLTKSSFHDETLLQAVVDLIGEPRA